MIDQEPVTKLGVLVPAGDNIRDVVIGFLERRGFQIGEMRRNGTGHADVRNAPVTLTIEHSEDLIRDVDEGEHFQLGFVGNDRQAEYRASLPRRRPPKVEELVRFDLFPARLRLSLLVRDNPYDNAIYQGVTALRDKTLVTTYPGLTRQFLSPYFPNDRVVPVNIVKKDGKEEGFVSSRAADAAVVIVDRGRTMRINVLRELLPEKPIMTGIQPVLIYNPEYFRQGENDSQDLLEVKRGRVFLLEQFLDRLQTGKKPPRFGYLFGIPSIMALRLLKFL